MALDATKWQIGVAKAIRYTGPDHAAAGANYVTVLELHRWLQSLADDASVAGGSEDYMDVTTVNPSDKKFDTIITLTNGYNLDDAYATPASEFIYGGSIIQNTGSEAIYDGVKVVANRGIYVNVIQDNAVLTNNYWNSQPDGESFIGINPDAANGVAMQFMVKIKTAGANIDNTTLLFTTREWGKTFSEFRIPTTGRGVNVVPLTYATDLNNATAIGDLTAVPFSDVVNATSGYNLIDVDNNATNEEYYSEWNKAGCTINQFYERMKYLTRRGSAESLYGLTGPIFRGITHLVDIGTPTGGAFVEGGATALSWTGGTGQILANDPTDDILYIQLLTGVSPGTAITVTQGAVSATTASTATEKTVSTPFCGASTGSSIVGSYGFSLEYADLAVNDKIQALDGTTRQPPNNVTFTVSGVASGYRVLVGPEDGASGLDYDQLTLTAQLTGASVATFTVNEAIPANTPIPGTVRIKRVDGSFTLHNYNAVNTGTKTFTFTTAQDFSSNFSHATQMYVFISYIDAAASGASISYTTIQTATQTLFIEARYGGTGDYSNSIKPAKTTGTLGSTGGSATISAVSDA